MALNLASFLHDSALQYPRHPALICGERAYTYTELERWSRQIADFFRIQGLRKGDHVLLLAPNVPEFTAVYFAVLHIGAVVVPVNIQLLPREIAALLEHSDAKYIVVWHALAEKGLAAFESVESCQQIFFIGEKNVLNANNTKENILSGYASSPLHRPNKFILDEFIDTLTGDTDCEQTSPDDTAVILYTSGTTGKPKGVELTHFNLFSNAFYTQSSRIFLEHNSIAVAVLPLFHTFGQTAIQNASLLAGATTVMIPQFEVRKALGEIEKHRVTHIAAVPTMYNLMLQTLKRRQYDLSALKVAVSGGASLPAELFYAFERVFGFTINEGYGLSETSPIVCMAPAVQKNSEPKTVFPAVHHEAEYPVVKPSSIGPVLFGTQAAILRDDNTFADTGEVGELVVRGHSVMKGYYKDSAATEAAFVNGWFKTGDVAKQDTDGWFYIVDRSKDVIIRAGMNIYPREIEEVLYHHPAVLEAAVVGIPDKTLSEDVVAFVVLKSGTAEHPVNENVCTADDLLKYCREHMALYKCPKTVVFLDALPKNSTGKIQKRDLKNR